MESGAESLSAVCYREGIGRLEEGWGHSLKSPPR